jgi:hypothetical protein
MKTIPIIFLGCALFAGACSRSEKQPDSATQTPPASLKSDAERLQQATAKAAEERKRSEVSPAPSAAQP